MVAKIKKENNKCGQGRGEIGTSCAADETINQCSPRGKLLGRS